MHFGLGITAAVIAAIIGITPERGLAQGSAPMELPPASYSGRQYVDSAGCVFVRAGYGENVRWVPRVNRDRTPLCNYKPTFAGEARPVLDIARTAPAPQADTAEVASARPTTAPVTKPARPAASATSFGTATGAPMETIASAMVPKPAPRPTAVRKVTAPAPAAPPVDRVITSLNMPHSPAVPASAGQYVSPYAFTGGTDVAEIASVRTVTTTACPNGVTSAQRYSLSNGRTVLRCGAPVENPAAFINAAAVPGLNVAPASGYVSPYMAGGTAQATMPTRSTAMYRNTTALPTTGVTSVSPQMPVAAAQNPQQAYARTSPYAAELIPNEVYVKLPSGPATLAPVTVATKSHGGTGYRPAFSDGRLNPYRGPRADAGDAQMAQIWTNEVPARLVTRNTPVRRKIAVQVQTSAAQTDYNVVQYSSKSSPARPAAAAKGRYVQVGSFGQAANAAGAKARLSGMGLPVTSARSGGLQVVLAGPFSSTSQLQSALRAARASGFGDAFIR
ncbi:hypothetical protein BFP70_00885 [Thioclava sp. SK-1]|uniref:SPOR domain-containing protein n=1 Tax=Thioclava sp. SK-1 TaxID=1889770 RepID=UPI00082486F5|nr:SPOR domain-containing protein [Thioclava sp. SK-1]OCX66746.1 hypothetical protein BFP70_00885 [Thioclava sp. SK-1]